MRTFHRLRRAETLPSKQRAEENKAGNNEQKYGADATGAVCTRPINPSQVINHEFPSVPEVDLEPLPCLLLLQDQYARKVPGTRSANAMVERSLFRAGFSQSYLLILLILSQRMHLILCLLSEPKWSQVKIKAC
jgi:hypothetical protein